MKFFTLKSFLSILCLCLLVLPSYAQQNHSMDFDGTDDEINCGTINLSGTAMTIETWINPDAFQPNFPFISTVGGIEQAGNTALLRLGDAGVANNRLQFVLQIGVQRKLESIGTLAANTWTHVAATYDGSNMRIYINGVLDASLATTGSVSGTGTFFISQSFGGRWLNGQMDDFRIWTTARTGAQISGSMNTELSGNETGLAAYYKFDDDGASCDVVDCSPNENHGARIGNAGGNNLPQFDTNIPTGITDVACGATLVNCVLSCSNDISAISTANFSNCFNNNTPGDHTDDTFTGDVTVTFSSIPATGTLDLSGDGTASVAVGSLAGTSHTFTGVVMPSDGFAVDLTASFSDGNICSFNNANAGTAPGYCSVNATGIPTMSEWGLILFALIMFSLSVVYGTQYQQRMALGQNMAAPAQFNLRSTFNKNAFLKVLPLVYLGFAALFLGGIAFFGYEMTAADIPGSILSGAVIAYLIQFLNQRTK